MTILVCAPHPDDEMIGMGGTISKYSDRGEEVIVIIFSLGENSHPWQRKEQITSTRQTEAINAGKIAGTAKTIFLKLKDTQISKEVVENQTQKEMMRIIDETKPSKIFIPALDDVHNDHRAVSRFMLSLRDQSEIDSEFWMYTVWSPFFIINRRNPRLVVDITKYFPKKWKAINAYESQKVSTFQLIPTVMLRGLFHGIRYKMTMAEVFLKAPEEWR